VQRFPPPDFESGYKQPVMTRPRPRAGWEEAGDEVLLGSVRGPNFAIKVDSFYGGIDSELLGLCVIIALIWMLSHQFTQCLLELRATEARPDREMMQTLDAERTAASWHCLDRCASAASRCLQRKPDDRGCLPAVRVRCAAALTKLAGDEARLIAAVTRRCTGLSPSEVLGQDGLAYGDIATSCSARFGRKVANLAGVAQCLAAQHACRAEVLFALERPRAGELLRLVDATPDAEACREDFGGSGLGLGDPKGVGKTLERCVQTIVKGGAGLVRTRLGAVGRCVDNVFFCVEAESGSAACLAASTQKCAREFTHVQRVIEKLATTTGKSCSGLDFAALSGPAGAYLDAVKPACSSYGIPAVNSVTDYVACLVQQHECEVADLVRFESPRAEALLDQVGRTLVDGTCLTP
jgi:hypothetical protein